MKWTILDTGMHTANENMALDVALLDDLAIDKTPLLHFYEWERDAATYGHFVDPKKFLKSTDLDLAKRPTGGGIIFHVADFAFSILVPNNHPSFSINPLDNYAFINNHISKAVAHLGNVQLLPDEEVGIDGFCMARPTKYDVMVGGQKIGGAAQRKTKHGYLHQGSISLALPSEEFLLTYLEKDVVEAMQKNSFAPLGSDWSFGQLQEARRDIQKRIIEVFV